LTSGKQQKKSPCWEFFLQFPGLDMCERVQARAYVRYELSRDYLCPFRINNQIGKYL